MNLDFYRNYIAIVESGTLSAAAKSLHVAQPALSNQVKQLEEEYGLPLLTRNARQMIPTDAGQILYGKAKNMILLEDAARKEIQACAAGAAGTLHIGMTQASPDASMTELLLSFHRENPSIRYNFYEVNSNEIMSLLRNGVVEIGIVRTSGLLPPDLSYALKFEQQLCAYCCYNNPWISPYGKNVSLSSLHNVPLALSRGFVPLLTDVFQRANVQPVIMSVATSRMNPMMWAREGSAVAIICVGKSEISDNAQTFCRPLVSDDESISKELEATRSFITLKDRQLSPTALKFIQFSIKYFGKER